VGFQSRVSVLTAPPFTKMQPPTTHLRLPSAACSAGSYTLPDPIMSLNSKCVPKTSEITVYPRQHFRRTVVTHTMSLNALAAHLAPAPVALGEPSRPGHHSLHRPARRRSLHCAAAVSEGCNVFLEAFAADHTRAPESPEVTAYAPQVAAPGSSSNAPGLSAWQLERVPALPVRPRRGDAHPFAVPLAAAPLSLATQMDLAGPFADSFGAEDGTALTPSPVSRAVGTSVAQARAHVARPFCTARVASATLLQAAAIHMPRPVWPLLGVPRVLFARSAVRALTA